MKYRIRTAAVALILSVPAFAFERYDGNAYALDSDRLLYRESHYLADGVMGRERIVLYRCADGRPFARKRVVDGDDPQMPDFDLEDARVGYREGVRRGDGQREAYVRFGALGSEQSAVLELPRDGVIDAGFDAYVQKHWSELSAGVTQRFEFLVPSKRTFYAFDLRAAVDTENPHTLRLRLSLGNWWGFLLPHIDVVYDRASRRLLSFAGLTNIRGSSFESLRARIVFSGSPTAVSRDDYEAARAQPLTHSCEMSGMATQ